jgi:hypothetical protein
MALLSDVATATLNAIELSPVELALVSRYVVFYCR